jgi:ParB family chromosome partitioning protein
VEKEVRELDLEKISPNLRLVYSFESIEELCRSLLFFGQLEPIQIWFDGERFRILDGEKRWRACRMLGINRVKVIIIERVISVQV